MKIDLINKRLSKTRKIGWLLARLPFVRCVILNGSLAQGKSKESSDIDIMIIAKSSRIFSARFFINVLASILRIKRPKDDTKNHAGKFCFNHFLTENYLKIPVGRGEEMDRYCAENFNQSKFIAGDKILFKKFIKKNLNLFDKYNCHPNLPLCRPEHIRQSQCKLREGSSERSERAAKPRFFANAQNDIKRIFEYFFGNWFEQIVKNYQIKKIESDSRTKKYPTLIVYNDKELRFHPPSHKLRRTGSPK